MKVGTYKGYDIWVTAKGYYRAYKQGGNALIQTRSTLTGIKKLIRGISNV